MPIKKRNGCLRNYLRRQGSKLFKVLFTRSMGNEQHLVCPHTQLISIDCASLLYCIDHPSLSIHYSLPKTTSESLCSESTMNPSAISTLIENNRYNIEILPQLENYVQTQVDSQSYHFDANHTVIKFYQFNPEKIQKMIVGKILVKALMNLPSNDFQLLMFMIPERLVSLLAAFLNPPQQSIIIRIRERIDSYIFLYYSASDNLFSL